MQIIALASNPSLQLAVPTKSIIITFLKYVALKVDINTSVLLSEFLLPIVYDENTLKSNFKVRVL